MAQGATLPTFGRQAGNGVCGASGVPVGVAFGGERSKWRGRQATRSGSRTRRFVARLGCLLGPGGVAKAGSVEVGEALYRRQAVEAGRGRWRSQTWLCKAGRSVSASTLAALGERSKVARGGLSLPAWHLRRRYSDLHDGEIPAASKTCLRCA